MDEANSKRSAAVPAAVAGASRPRFGVPMGHATARSDVYGKGSKSGSRAFGTFWQREYWDTLIRNEEHLNRAVLYIEANPERAGLANWQWICRASCEE